MFDSAQVILIQLVKMFIYILIGFCLFKAKLITEEGSRNIANLMIYALIPSVILNSMMVDPTAENVRMVLYSLYGGALAMAVACVISFIFFRKNPIYNFGSTFSNAGFMGMALISSALGKQALLSVTGFFFVQTVIMWIYNIFLMRKEDEKPNIKGLFLSPVTISLVVGFIIFFAKIPVPNVLKDCISTMSACNSPVAMVVLGVYIGKTKFSEIFTTPKLYLLSAVRLLIIPIFTILVLFAVPRDMMLLRTSMDIAASAPVAVNTAVFSQKAGMDYTLAVKAICLTTIFSIIALPLSLVAAGAIWG